MSEKTTVGQTSNRKQTSSLKQSYIEQLSWEYLMPKRKERAAGYIRESDPTLADSNTIDSQANAVRLYCEKEGYIYDVAVHEYREAISAYTTKYTQRTRLLDMLAAAKRHEFDVLVLSEIRALSRQQVEVFVIYDILKKYGVRLETIQEKFEDSAMGRYILASRAMIAEVERENTHMRTQRGKRDRLNGGAPNGHPKPAYGYIMVDTEREAKARYEFNNKVIYVDAEGTEWTEVKVCLYIFDLVKQGESLRSITITLNELGVPPPKKPRKKQPHWQVGTIYNIVTNRMYIGEVWANKYTRVGKKLVKRPQSEQILLPEGTAPALIDKETFEKVQERLAMNKQDSLRNNHHPQDLGILRAGYCHCGICGRTMNVKYHNPTPTNDRRKPEYICQRKTGKEGLEHNHITVITVSLLDKKAWEKAVTVLKDPEQVRAKVEKLREDNKPIINIEDVEATIEDVRRRMNNLYRLAEAATDNETIDDLTVMMNDFEKQKRAAEALIYDIEEDEEERQEVEEEISRFKEWAENVRPKLTDPTYEPTYEEKRLAVRIIGIHATVFPESGDFPFRAQVDATIPAIVSKMKYCVPTHQSYTSCGQTECSTGKSGETL